MKNLKMYLALFTLSLMIMPVFGDVVCGTSETKDLVISGFQTSVPTGPGPLSADELAAAQKLADKAYRDFVLACIRANEPNFKCRECPDGYIGCEADYFYDESAINSTPGSTPLAGPDGDYALSFDYPSQTVSVTLSCANCQKKRRTGNVPDAGDPTGGRIGDFSSVDNSYTELNVSSKARVYPNPSTGVFYVEIETTSLFNDGYISLYDLTGKLVVNQYCGEIHLGKYNYELRAENIPSGLYIVTITLDGVPHKVSPITIQ